MDAISSALGVVDIAGKRNGTFGDVVRVLFVGRTFPNVNFDGVFRCEIVKLNDGILEAIGRSLDDGFSRLWFTRHQNKLLDR